MYTRTLIRTLDRPENISVSSKFINQEFSKEILERFTLLATSEAQIFQVCARGSSNIRRNYILQPSPTPNTELQAASAISFFIRHGDADDQLTMHELLDTLPFRSLQVTCGRASKLTAIILREQNIESRVVMISSHPDNFNGIDDAHTLIEIWIPLYRKWVLFDPTFKNILVDSISLQPISLVNFISGVDFRVKKLLPCAMMALPTDAALVPVWDHLRIVSSNEDELRLWYQQKQVTAAYRFDDSGIYKFIDNEAARKIVRNGALQLQSQIISQSDYERITLK